MLAAALFDLSRSRPATDLTGVDLCDTCERCLQGATLLIDCARKESLQPVLRGSDPLECMEHVFAEGAAYHYTEENVLSPATYQEFATEVRSRWQHGAHAAALGLCASVVEIQHSPPHGQGARASRHCARDSGCSLYLNFLPAL